MRLTTDLVRTRGWLIYSGIAGSHAYGLDLPSSDVDVRGVYVQPLDHILGFKYVPQVSFEGVGADGIKRDVVYYEIRRFIELLRKGNPNTLELLALPPELNEYTSGTFLDICAEKDRFLNRGLVRSFIGMAISNMKEYRRNGKVKAMVHTIRTLNMAEDIFVKGKLIVRRPQEEIDFLLSLYHDPSKIDEMLLKDIEDQIELLDKVALRANLPDRIDVEFCHNLLVKIRRKGI